MKQLIIGIDFDGTCVEHEFPKIGKDVPHAAEVLRELNKQGHKLILWTIRSNQQFVDPTLKTTTESVLQQVVDWFNKNNIKLWGVNKNPQQYQWSNSNKQYCDLYIDDAALGCPLIITYNFKLGKTNRPYVDWKKVRSCLVDDGVLKD
jgi:hypothetical protein